MGKTKQETNKDQAEAQKTAQAAATPEPEQAAQNKQTKPRARKTTPTRLDKSPDQPTEKSPQEAAVKASANKTSRNKSSSPVKQKQQMQVCAETNSDKKINSSAQNKQQKFAPVEEESKQMTISTGSPRKKSAGQGKKKSNKQQELEQKPVLEGYLGPMPKKNVSAYIIFSVETGKKLAEEQPNHDISERQKLIGQLWNQLSDEQKKPYVERSEKDKTRFERQLDERTKLGYFTLEDNSKSTDPKNIALFNPKNYQHDKEAQNMPKGSQSAYMYYFGEQSKKLHAHYNKEKPFGEISKMIGEAWNNLSAEDRAPYEKLAAEDKYRQEQQLLELHQYGYFTLPDGSKSIDEQNRPVVKKRQAKSEQKEAKATVSANEKSNQQSQPAEKTVDEIKVVGAKKRKAKSPIEEECKVAK